MILDTLRQASRYSALHPGFARAFEFLSRHDLAAIPPGRHELDGRHAYVSLDMADGRRHEGARLESHRRYIDIQYTIEGEEEIGWMPVSSCASPVGGFDDARDVIFYEDRPGTWLQLPPGRFAILFPTDAHAPLAGQGPVRKVIVKVAVD